MQSWYITEEGDVTVMFSQIFRSISIDNVIMQMRRPMWLGVSFIVRRAHPLVVHWIIWLYPCITGDCTLVRWTHKHRLPSRRALILGAAIFMRNTYKIITFLRWIIELFWHQLCHHWWQWKLSLQQFTAPLLMTKSVLWELSVFSVVHLLPIIYGQWNFCRKHKISSATEC